MFFKKRLIICFDLDSTLLNSDKAHIKSYNYALRKLGFPEKKSREIIEHFGKPHYLVGKAITPEHTSWEKIAKLTKIHDDILIKEYWKFSKTLPFVKDIIKRLYNKKYHLYILSNCNIKVIFALLKGAVLNKKYFKKIIGADKVECSKPCPAAILRAEKLEKHKVDFMVGDSIYDIMAANNAKVKSIGVLTGCYTIKQLKKVKPFKIIKNLKTLPGFLEKVVGNKKFY